MTKSPAEMAQAEGRQLGVDTESVRTDSIDTPEVRNDDGSVALYDSLGLFLYTPDFNNRIVIDRKIKLASSLIVSTPIGDIVGNFPDLLSDNIIRYDAQDVRNLSGVNQGYVAYHDGSGANTEGLAAYNGTDWISQVDGTTIS